MTPNTFYKDKIRKEKKRLWEDVFTIVGPCTSRYGIFNYFDKRTLFGKALVK